MQKSENPEKPNQNFSKIANIIKEGRLPHKQQCGGWKKQMKDLRRSFKISNPTAIIVGSKTKSKKDSILEKEQEEFNSLQKQISKVEQQTSSIDQGSLAVIQMVQQSYSDAIKTHFSLIEIEQSLEEIQHIVDQNNIQYAETQNENSLQMDYLISQINQANMKLKYQQQENTTLEQQVKNELKEIAELQKQYELMKMDLQNAQLPIQQERQFHENLQKQKLMEAELYEVEFQLNGLDYNVAVLRCQVPTSIRCGFSVYNNLHCQLSNFEVQNWNQAKSIDLSRCQIKFWIISKLYPAREGLFIKFPTRSPVFEALFQGNTQRCSIRQLQSLDGYLFQNLANRTPFKRDKILRYIALGSATRPMFNEALQEIISGIQNFRGYLLKVKSIEVNSHFAHEALSILQINYTFDESEYKREILLINLDNKIDHQIIEALMRNDLMRKDELSTAIHNVLGKAPRKGVIHIEIPELYEKNQKQNYSKIYKLMKDLPDQEENKVLEAQKMNRQKSQANTKHPNRPIHQQTKQTNRHTSMERSRQMLGRK